MILIVIQTTRFCLQTKKTTECEKSTLTHQQRYSFCKLVLTFQQNGVIMVRGLGMHRMLIKHFLAYFEFTVPFQPILSFLSLTLGIVDKDSNWAVSFIFSTKKIVCPDRKMEIKEQSHQGNTNWSSQWNTRGIFSNFSNLLQTKRLPWSFSTNHSWILSYQKPVDLYLALD